MLIIGLTGSLATGKSSVAALFKKKGAIIIDADKIAHTAFKKESATYKKVVKEFGVQVLRSSDIDRRSLAKIVFSSKRKLKKLENIIHPYVRKVTRQKLAQYKKAKRRVVMLEVPLLFESGFYKMTDFDIVVTASKNSQIQRAVKKLKITKAEAKRRIESQMSLKQKIRKADFIINNNQDRTKTKKQVDLTWQKLIQKIKK